MMTDTIQQKLNSALSPKLLEVLDNSAAHAGHAGARKGGGHYHVTIVSETFDGRTLVQRHQLIYQALGAMMEHDIHALGINALTPSEHS